MRLLVLGVNGMLGHRLARSLADRVEVWGTSRGPMRVPEGSVLDPSRHLTGVSATDFPTVADALARSAPEVVVNCIGVVKQRSAAKNAVPSIEINSLFPHRLAAACCDAGVRLIHLSTDCVFSGAKGMYGESDVPDAEDLYGRSKLLGELTESGCLTLRTSMIGWQLTQHTGLLGWFAANRGGNISGYRNVFFSGLSTESLANLIGDLAVGEGPTEGLYHVSGERIDKNSLLARLDALLGWGTNITGVDEPALDRSLDSSRFRAATGWMPPSWDEMLAGLAADRAWYDALPRTATGD
ncbi:MAG TPA: SDR family oxidoreductase [Coriobacteriia bacterium]